MLRIFHVLAIVCLVGAAVVVYKVKYESTYEAQRTAKLRAEIRTERERITMLQAEWMRLSAPARIQELASRHLGMKPLDVSRIDEFSALPEKPHKTGDGDLIGEFIETLSDKEETDFDPLTDFLQALNRSGKAETTGLIRKRN